VTYQIASAEGCAGNLENGIARVMDLGSRPVFNCHLTDILEDDGAHGFWARHNGSANLVYYSSPDESYVEL
jgi:hypothetical protein